MIRWVGKASNDLETLIIDVEEEINMLENQ